ncbi:MAG: SixA phosphatase family protein [Acidimicrobiales bacterium]
MVKLYVVRHADAGHRTHGVTDRNRTLSDRGRRQADGLRDALADKGITRLLASPFTRCLQTLAPLGDKLDLPVDADDRLAEGAAVADVLALTQELRKAPAAICSHGDVIPDLLEALVADGITLKDDLRWQKASTWVLTWDGARLAKGRYTPPPA